MIGYRRFVLGKEPFPQWFNEQAAKGRVRIQTDLDTGEIVGAILYTATRTIHANVGDTILLSRAGLSIVTAEESEKQVRIAEQSKEKRKKE